MVKGKNFNFIASNLRRSKWQIIAISILLILASALINILFFLSMDYQQNFFREKTRLNGEDIDILLMNTLPGADCYEQLNAALDACEIVNQYEIDPVVTAPGSVEYKDAVIGNHISFMSYDTAIDKQIGQYEILESNHADGIYLSYIFKIDGGYGIGQDVTVKLGAKEYKFKIAGFYNNVNTGTSNCTDIVLLLPDSDFDSVASAQGVSYRISALLNEPENVEILETDLTKRIAENCPTLTFLGSSTYKKLSTSRYITATLFEAIISVSAVLMITVILATIAITLSNYIRNNIRNLGAMKALGYKSHDLILPIVGEFSVIAFMMSLIGTLFSYAVMPVLNNALEKQVGIPYKIHFLFEQAALSILICVLMAALSSYYSVLKIRRIYPIHAIRDSKTKQKTSHNFFALDKTHFGLNTAISLKSLLSDGVHGIVLFVSMTVIAFLLGFSAFTYQNVILDQNAILDLVCGQRTDSVLNVSREYEDLLLSELNDNSSVEQYYLYSAFPVSPSGKPKIYAYIIDEDYHARDRLCIKGHMPKSEGDIAVNRAYADKYGINLGDTLSFETENGLAEFTINGMIQGAFYSGIDCYITYDGYSRISAMPFSGYYVDLKKGTDIDEFNSEISKKCPLISCSNYAKSVEAASESYIDILILATAVVVILSFVIAAFILYILISVLLANKHREHGILKSLGFVSKDIVYQTVFCNMPPCVLGTALGLLISRNGAAKLLASALSGIGIFVFGIPTKLVYLFIAGGSVIFFAIVVSILMSGSVRKITPHQLFNKE